MKSRTKIPTTYLSEPMVRFEGRTPDGRVVGFQVTAADLAHAEKAAAEKRESTRAYLEDSFAVVLRWNDSMRGRYRRAS